MTRTSLFAGSLALALLSGSAALAEGNIAIPDAGFAPEGVTIDHAGTIYVGSLTEGRILRVRADNSSPVEFVTSGVSDLVSVVGLHASADDTTIFACSSDAGVSKLGKTVGPALVAFDRATGAPAGRYELPEGGAFCNDITELPDGSILATDSFVSRIYVLKPGVDHLEVWFEDAALQAEGFNFNGIAYSDGHVYFVRYSSGTLHEVAANADGSAGAVATIELERKLSGPDGLTALGGGRFLIVEGGGLSAGARGQLTGATVQGTSAALTTIAADLNVPTTAAVRGGIAYVVEGQLANLFDPAAGPADPYRILAIELPAEYR